MLKFSVPETVSKVWCVHLALLVMYQIAAHVSCTALHRFGACALFITEKISLMACSSFPTGSGDSNPLQRNYPRFFFWNDWISVNTGFWAFPRRKGNVVNAYSRIVLIHRDQFNRVAVRFWRWVHARKVMFIGPCHFTSYDLVISFLKMVMPALSFFMKALLH